MRAIRLTFLCLVTAFLATSCARKLSESQLTKYAEDILLDEVDTRIQIWREDFPDLLASPNTNIYISIGYDESKRMYLPPSDEILEKIRSRGLICRSITNATFNNEMADGVILFCIISWSDEDKCYECYSGTANGLPGNEMRWNSGGYWHIRRKYGWWVVEPRGGWVS